MAPGPERFELRIPDSAIEDLRRRLSATRLPDQAPGSAWDYGTDLAYMRGLIAHWHNRFD
jgi:Epoxide hydrolase N terminus